MKKMSKFDNMYVITQILDRKPGIDIGPSKDDHFQVPFGNDYVINPIISYVAVKVLVEGNETDCTDFWLESGLRFTAPVNTVAFGKFALKMQEIKNDVGLELKSTEKCHSSNLQGKIIYSLN